MHSVKECLKLRAVLKTKHMTLQSIKEIISTKLSTEALDYTIEAMLKSDEIEEDGF